MPSEFFLYMNSTVCLMILLGLHTGKLYCSMIIFLGFLVFNSYDEMKYFSFWLVGVCFLFCLASLVSSIARELTTSIYLIGILLLPVL